VARRAAARRSSRSAVAHAERFVCRAYEIAGQPPWRAEHSLQVGDVLAELGCSDVVVTAGVLHDVVEDTAVTREDVAEEFGEPVADLVAELTEDPSIAGYRERKRAASIRTAGWTSSHADLRRGQARAHEDVRRTR
jgi:(p)ppGpp synthase/HD superfamily hydrolase